MTKEPITFDKLPQAVSYLIEQVNNTDSELIHKICNVVYRMLTSFHKSIIVILKIKKGA